MDQLERIRDTQESKLQTLCETKKTETGVREATLARLRLDLATAQEETEQAWAQNKLLQHQLSTLTYEHQDERQAMLDREQDLQHQVHEHQSQDQRLSEYETSLSNLRADLALVTQDLTRSSTENETLEAVLSQVSSEHQKEKTKWRTSQTQARLEHEAERLDLETQYQSRIEVLEAQLRSSQKDLLESRADDRRLRQAQRQLSSSEAAKPAEPVAAASGTMIDTRVASQVIVKFIQSGYHPEVLTLMSKLFDFTLEEKQQAGLTRARARGISEEDLEGKDFGDLLAEYLLHEADET